jgi:putative oxidoreductase
VPQHLLRNSADRVFTPRPFDAGHTGARRERLLLASGGGSPQEIEMLERKNESLWGQWAPLPLRLVIGYGFIVHGWAKLAGGPAGFARLLDQIGAPLPEVTAWVSVFIEILGGLAILAGAFVAAVSVPLIVMMLVALFTVHLRYGFSAINTIGLTADGPQFSPPGYEVNLLYIAGLLALILGGAGRLSIDGLRARRKQDSGLPPSPADA